MIVDMKMLVMVGEKAAPMAVPFVCWKCVQRMRSSCS